jgi:tRNA(fMet)-specific endonuclease VapC
MYLYLLDTDHVSLLNRGGETMQRIKTRIAAQSPDTVAVSIVTYEEQFRGWTAELAKVQAVDKQMETYARLNRMRQYYCATPVLLFDEKCLAQFQTLWIQRLRVGTMDLKIAATALANNATLITRNTSDFSKVPGLTVEDWTIE